MNSKVNWREFLGSGAREENPKDIKLCLSFTAFYTVEIMS